MGVLWPEIAKDLYPDKTDFEIKEIYAIISIVLVFLIQVLRLEELFQFH